MSAAAGAAAAAAIANAIKASGVLVKIEPGDFEELVRGMGSPLVIHQPPSGVFQRRHRYLTHYRGFTFHAESAEPLFLPREAEVVPCRQIWIPG